MPQNEAEPPADGSENAQPIRYEIDKADVAAILDEVGNLLELDGGNPFEVRAYHNGARAIEMLEGDIGDKVRDGSIEDVPGLGKTLIARITELLTTGHMAMYDELASKVPPGLRQMMAIPGLGPKRVRQLHQTLGVTTIGDLRTAGESDRIAKVSGFGAKTQEKILKGIEFLEHSQDQFAYPVAEHAAVQIYEVLSALPQTVRMSIAGSLRRHKEIIGDIDIVGSVARDEDRMAIMDTVVKLPQVASVTAHGPTKTSVVLRSSIALDVRLVSDDEFPYVLHHFTGSKEHNVALRGLAHDRGLKINEYGIFRGAERIDVTDGRGFYAVFGMQYIEPEMREGRGEIQAALEHKLPTLITSEDIQGILHVHSTWSDGKNTIHEMAEAARAMGMRYLGMCDHSQHASYAGGLNADAVRRQHAEIDRLNAEYAGEFRILKGTECDILKDGSLDFPDELLATFDLVVASIHSNFNLPPEEQTQRLIRAMENPYTSFLGHPTGRILLGRTGYEPDMERVIVRAGELGTAIELNADPSRLDLDWRWHRLATEHGVRIPINPDAHTPGGLHNIRFGVGIARKGWLTKQDVPNAWPLDELLAFFAEERARKRAKGGTSTKGAASISAH